jgi:hypothetical protein
MDKSILDLKLGYVTHACRRVIKIFMLLKTHLIDYSSTVQTIDLETEF